MTISSQNRQAGPFVGNDTATAFPFAFKVFIASDLQVVRTDSAGVESTLVLNTDYTATLNSNQDSNPGGTVTLPTVLATGYKLTATSSIAPLQATDLTNQGGFYPKVITNALDKLTILIQQIFNGLNRSIKLPISNSDDGTLPAGDRANTVIGFDAVGKLKLLAVQTGTSLVDLAASAGASLVGFVQFGVGAIKRTIQDKLRETISVKDFGAVGDLVADDTAAIRAAWAALPIGGKLVFPSATGYKITDTLQFFDKGRVKIDFNSQLIDASSFSTPKIGLHFKGVSHARIDGIFIIGNTTNVDKGVFFDADADSITIHAVIGKIHASDCNIGVMVGNASGYQFSDSSFEDIYGADCNIGVYLTGENTLAMYYQRVAAYNNNNYGVLIEQGGGTIGSLQVADSGADIYFGSTAGTNHNKLNRWDILSGYSEEGANGELFIGSTACVDGNFFKEQIVINGFRCTPFTSTNIQDFVRWNLNGDLIFRHCTFSHGTQLPKIKVDNNTSYRAPRVVLDDCAIGANLPGAAEVPMLYQTTSSKQRVEMNCRVDNAITFWQNNGSANEGVMKRGIYMSKLRHFEQALISIAGLTGAWHLRDITSATCENLVLGKPSLTASATIERRDVWLDDGLIGFYRNSTTSKTLSTPSTEYAAGEYTFGCFLRTANAGLDETDYTALGGSGGINLAIGDTGGGFVRCMVGGYNCQGTPSSPLDPHLVIGRYVPGVSVKMNAINLRTGEVISATVGSGPAIIDLTWTNGVSIRNDYSVRGFPFVYSRALSDNEVSSLLQSALMLTDSWRS